MRELNYRDKKCLSGDKVGFFEHVVQDYHFGKLTRFSKVEIGYEDDNYILETTIGTYFVKIFGLYRDINECRRYVEIIQKACTADIKTPKMYPPSLNIIDGRNLSVFEFVDGKTFYELKQKPTKSEAKVILSEAAKINGTNFKPTYVYDEWAIVNAADQYQIVKNYLSTAEKSKIEPLVKIFIEIKSETLPHCFVHGDIITTNVIRNSTGGIYVIDFACANYYPRLLELAVIACNLLADYDHAYILEEYGRHNPLTDREKELFPLFVDLAHAMHIIGAVRERDIYGNASAENEYWLNQGRSGLGL
ncbi:MAG: phosphotransferase [Patescibacteria group bacterium]|jgi:Ser/Thr protein kinase RdoA (MazF antagonist)